MPASVNRRELLRLALGGAAVPAATGLAASLSSPLSAQSASAKTGPAPQPEAFSAAKVVEMARALAAEPHKPPGSAPLDPLGSASPEEIATIRYRTGDLIWAGAGLAFAIEPVHRSRNFPGEVELYTVEGTTASRVVYDPARCDFGTLKPPPASAHLGFTGFRILRRRDDGQLLPAASLVNASILAGIAPNQAWGAISRPLSVHLPDQIGEEPSQMRAVWIEQPRSVATELVMHALVDTPSLAGAIRFTLRADDATVIDTECTLFTRKQVDHLALAPVQATYLAGPIDWPPTPDMRPAVYEAAGVQMQTGNGEWIWRPVSNRSRLQISGFVDRDPQGYGLMQRDRGFGAFLDDENDWQRRPSVWIEPIGKWGAGEVTLLEIPAASQNNKNIACYWRPRPGLAAGAEVNYAYRQFWSWQAPSRPDGAIVTASRIGRIPGDTSEGKTRFLVQFEGGQLGDPAKAAAIVPTIWSSAGKVAAIRVYRAPRQNSMRVVFDLDAGGQPLVELRVWLKHDNAPMSEAWLYRWTQ